MITIRRSEFRIGEITTAMLKYGLVAIQQAMHAALRLFCVAGVTLTARFHGVSADFANYAFVRFFFNIGVRNAAVALDTANFGVYIFFQVLLFINKYLFPYLQRR